MPIQNEWTEKLSPELRKPYMNEAERQRLIIEMTKGSTVELQRVIEANQGTIHRELTVVPALVVDLPVGAFETLATSSRVRFIWQDTQVQAMMDVTAREIGVEIAQEHGYKGDGVVVAVLDTGISPHEDLSEPNRILAWNDLINQKSSPYDDHGHGTHVAGIIAGNGHASEGKYRGVAPEARLVGVKVLDQNGKGWVSDVMAGIEWCLQNLKVLNIRIINLSLGGPAQINSRWDPLCRVTTEAWHRGVVVCAASGNNYNVSGITVSPAINPSIITVGNVDRDTILLEPDPTLKGGQQPRIKPDLVAPGSNITSLDLDEGYVTYSGSSMATPLVAGAVALILQKWPYLKPDQIKYVLAKRSRNLGLGSYLQGSGALDLEKIFGPVRKRIFQGKGVSKFASQVLVNTIMNLLAQRSSETPQSGSEILIKTIMSILGNMGK